MLSRAKKTLSSTDQSGSECAAYRPKWERN